MCYYEDILVAAGKRTALNNWIDNNFKDVNLSHETVTKNFLLAALGFHPLTQCDLPKDHHDYSPSCDGITLIKKTPGVNQLMRKNELLSMFIERYQNKGQLLKPARHILNNMSKRQLTQLAMERGFKDGQEVEFSKNGDGISVRTVKYKRPKSEDVEGGELQGSMATTSIIIIGIVVLAVVWHLIK